MKDNLAPKICYTAGGMLIHEGKALLIKHKKLGIWLNPGGHIDEGELPHEAVEREFWEETGVKVKALDALGLPGLNRGSSKSQSNFSLLDDSDELKQFKPNPISTNLHWVNKESYKLRLDSGNQNKRFPTKTWKRGCEKHVGFFYLLEPVAGVDFFQNEEETDGIAWFGLDEIDELETNDNVRKEVRMGFRLMGLD